MLGRGALTRTVVAQIVHVDSVDDVLVAALAAHGFQAGEEFVLAVEAAVGTVLRVSGIVEFVRLHVLMHDAEALHESFGIALVRFRKRGGVRGDSHGVPSEGAIGRPRQIGGVGAAGEGHDYAAHGGEIGQQLLLLLLDGAGCDEVRQSGHNKWTGRRPVLPSLLQWEQVRFVGGRLLGFRQDAGGGHLVAFLQIHQADALRGAPGLPDGGRLDADDLAVLADNHDVGILLHQQNAHYAPGLVGGLHVDDALAAAGNQAVGCQRGALAVTVFGDGEEQPFLLSHLHADQVIVRVETHTAHAARLAAHGAHVFLAEAYGLAPVGSQEHVVVAVRDLGADEFVAVVQRDGDDAARHGVVELGELAFLDDAVFGDHHDVLVGDEILDAEEGPGFLVILQVDEVAEVLALAGGGGVGNLVCLEPVDAAARGEDQQVGVGGSDNQALHEILGARAHADAPLAAAGLAAVGIDAGALEVAAARHGDGDVFHRYQVFQLDLAGVLDDLGAALVAETLLDFFEFLDNERAQNAVGAEQFEILGDAALDIGQLIEDLLLLHPGEALQLELDDGLRLLVAELEGGDQSLAGFARQFGRAHDADDFVEVVEGLLEAEQDMLAVARLAKLELGAPADHFDAVVDEEFDAIDQAELAGLPVDDGQHDDAEADLELGVLIKVVEDHLGLLATLELEDDAHAVAVALIADIADAVDFLFVDEGARGLDEAGLVDLVGDLGDPDLLQG